ncbi:hypothetical protein A3A38_01135 [Candidatus Kaiserbacteria bacterium RIFCSPLOWO2_01_FULL_53_17]|uniref:Uncharacterized protein n=1 Tax=Candidatus Kaiserbacteria bacterium RIFCSPLOWO2_01_FULL_53_17 TaxID=1798511 RepID=A0A1F6EH77_9BACT|nr:MAG: hypothetical protein A3A38_01135 [Candidatus Kaiserbacteria bacterium RIFCSPLOWO2_01_FULL_53_17]
MNREIRKGLTQVAFGAGSCLAGLILLYYAGQMPDGEPTIGALRIASFVLIALGLRIVAFA